MEKENEERPHDGVWDAEEGKFCQTRLTSRLKRSRVADCHLHDELCLELFRSLAVVFPG
jgi:hypothetical protein